LPRGRRSTTRTPFAQRTNKTGHASAYGERELFWIIKHGIRNTGMPAWGSLLSDEDIHQVAALVKRFDRLPEPPDAP